MDHEWYFEMDGRTGPVDLERLVQMKIDGIIDGDTPCECADDTKPYHQWEQLHDCEVRLMALAQEEEALREAGRVAKQQAVAPVAVEPPGESLGDIIDRIDRRNKFISGMTLAGAGVLGLILFLSTNVLEFKLKSGSGGRYSASKLGLAGFEGNYEREIPSRDFTESGLKSQGLEYRKALKQVSLGTAIAAQRVARYAALLMGIMFIITGIMILLSLLGLNFLAKAYLLNLLTLIPLIVFILAMAVFCVGGIANIKADISFVDAFSNQTLEGGMSVGYGFFFALALIFNAITGTIFSHKLNE
ncbi:hypothetical protein KKF84_21615 [Myxococcota bacterium]|nr:hypothetical protein [Myxococcota bacterium]